MLGMILLMRKFTKECLILSLSVVTLQAMAIVMRGLMMIIQELDLSIMNMILSGKQPIGVGTDIILIQGITVLGGAAGVLVITIQGILLSGVE